MSAQAIEQLVDRALSDEAFAARLRTDLAGAMAEYGLTAEEQAAFASRDPAKLEALGVDQRITKKKLGH